MDIEQARYNMIEQQIRPWEVLDQRVLDLLATVRREDYVPPVYRSLAFVDMEIPLGHGVTMWAPKMEARVLQSLGIGRGDRVLEVGTGSGYFTALLAASSSSVVSVEIVPELKDSAETRLRAHGFDNIGFRLGDAARDWTSDGKFDVIVLTGSSPVLPESYMERLNPGGRLFAVLGEAPAMRATLYTRPGTGAGRAVTLFETSIQALENAATAERFVF